MRDSSGWPTILVYHHVAEAGGPALDKLDVTTSPDVFEIDIKYCSKNFDMIDVSDLQDLRRIRRPLLVTFDDNYGSVVSDAAKILKSFSVPSIVFLNPGVLLGKTLPIDNLLSLAENRLGPDRLRSCLGLAADSSSALAHMIWRTLPNMSQPQLQAAKGALLDALGMLKRSAALLPMSNWFQR
jgi:peptidoglycan/xylan/chitin deacetylase (PgdA/CDA1 family)